MRTPHGIANQKLAKQRYRERNREKLKEKAKAYNASKSEERRMLDRNRYHSNPKRVLAQQKVRRALRKGLITKGTCACGSVDVLAHHEDYDKPLDVVWMCKPCHTALHLSRTMAERA